MAALTIHALKAVIPDDQFYDICRQKRRITLRDDVTERLDNFASRIAAHAANGRVRIAWFYARFSTVLG